MKRPRKRDGQDQKRLKNEWKEAEKQRTGMGRVGRTEKQESNRRKGETRITDEKKKKTEKKLEATQKTK